MNICLTNPTSTLPQYPIKELDIKDVASDVTILAGQSLQFTVKSQAEKSGFINITYDDPSKKTDNNKVLFYVYNNRTDLRDKKFEMSYIDSVLLPQSEDDFVIWLGAQGSDFTIDIKASDSRSLIARIFATMMAVFATLVLF